MRILGINCMNHDAAMAVVEYVGGYPGDILWAAHAERYSKIKNDHYLNQEIVDEAMTYGPFDKVVYYEKPLLKKTRQLYAGQFGLAFDSKEMPLQHLKKFGIKNVDEYLRLLDAKIHVEKHGEVCPANWEEGKEAMNASKDGVSNYLKNN